MSYLGEDPRLRAIHETLKAARAPRPRVAICDPRAPRRPIGPWVTEVIRRAGGIDLLAVEDDRTTDAGQVMPSGTGDALRLTDPELIVFVFAGVSLDEAVVLGQHHLADPAWDWARMGRSAVMESTLVQKPGPQLIDAVACLAPFIAPALFAPAPRHLARPITHPSA